MKEAEIPDWLGRYEELINDLRCPLRQFEDGKLDFKQFIDEVNNVLERYGYSHVEVDTSRKSRWDAWYDKRRSIIYVSNNVLNMDRRVLGRVFMHEVMHHVLLTKPPTLRLRLYNALSSHPRIFKALLLIATVLSIILLQYTALISLGIIMIIIYYLKQYSESAAEASWRTW
ncbi:zinc metallopeptidase [Vulcanisaeta sp. JCM 14467]|uniref:zinc metallopeptidase n=1 Tax=Vulcanisaeta sp. JCM 14467 TaxID=1295370 RepID=UPI0006D1FFA8|nr:zinc metallopeptidase [Vulcanisaeta sp. JCM 14467]